MTQQTIETQMPPQLATVIVDLVELSVRKAASGEDGSQVVDDLVDAARWNPALLMVAAERAGHVVDTCSDERFEAALDYLRAAEARLRKRSY